MCGESRTHSLEGVVEGRPSTTTLRFTGLKDFQDKSGALSHLQSFAPAEWYVTHKINVSSQCTEDNSYDQVLFSTILIAFIT